MRRVVQIDLYKYFCPAEASIDLLVTSSSLCRSSMMHTGESMRFSSAISVFYLGSWISLKSGQTRVSDAEAVSMSRYLVQNDGLFLGSSSACNLVASVKLAHKLGLNSGKVIVTIL